jgi:hypothetical protein
LKGPGNGWRHAGIASKMSKPGNDSLKSKAVARSKYNKKATQQQDLFACLAFGKSKLR